MMDHGQCLTGRGAEYVVAWQHCCQALFFEQAFLHKVRDFYTILRDFCAILHDFCDFYANFCQAQIFCCQAPKTILHPLFEIRQWHVGQTEFATSFLLLPLANVLPTIICVCMSVCAMWLYLSMHASFYCLVCRIFSCSHSF